MGLLDKIKQFFENLFAKRCPFCKEKGFVKSYFYTTRGLDDFEHTNKCVNCGKIWWSASWTKTIEELPPEKLGKGPFGV